MGKLKTLLFVVLLFFCFEAKADRISKGFQALKIYNYFEVIEKNYNKKRFTSKSSKSVYSVYTRQSSNFVFPSMGDKFDGEGRPRPNQFRLTEQDIKEKEKEEEIDLDKEKKKKKKY